ncbi:MAG: divalent metal cation transporter [Bacteroidota bacterium]
MNADESIVEQERRQLAEANQRGLAARLRVWTRLAGPGWLQSALMLGGGSLAGSLYLGVLTGVQMIWLQPIAMALTVVMFGALSYVVLSSEKPPFQAINEEINPVLGWSWALASLLSCMVWAMPQYALANGVLQQNLAPELLGPGGLLGDGLSRTLITLFIFLLVTSITWQYSKSGRAVQLFEWVLKIMIWLIVACFIGVVIRLATLPGGLDWSGILRGTIPDPTLFFQPAEAYHPLLDAMSTDARAFWSDLIVRKQREVMIAVAAAASGVNATFLLAYSLRRRGWGKEHRGLAIFDLSTGMLIPFALATSCVIIAGAHQFHGVAQPGFIADSESVDQFMDPSSSHQQEFDSLLRQRADALDEPISPELNSGALRSALPDADVAMAATLLTRDAFDLARSLEPLTGSLFARLIFGLGVLGMTLSSIILHMLVSGMVVCEMTGRPHTGWTLRLGSLAAATGVLGPFLWQKASFWLAIPTSVFAFILLPSAYFTFYLMLNNRDLMGRERPEGQRRWILNSVMLAIILLFVIVSGYVIWINAEWWGVAVTLLFLLAIAWGDRYRKKRSIKDEIPA